MGSLSSCQGGTIGRWPGHVAGLVGRGGLEAEHIPTLCTLLVSARRQRTWMPREGTCLTLRPGLGVLCGSGQHRAHTGATGSLACKTRQDSPRTQQVPWDPSAVTLSFESLWESLKALLAREVGGVNSPSPTEDPPPQAARQRALSGHTGVASPQGPWLST